MTACTNGTGAAPQKIKAEECKKLSGYIPLLFFLKVEETKRENCDFVHFLPLFYSVMHNLKTVRCTQILYIPNGCSDVGNLPFLV